MRTQMKKCDLSEFGSKEARLLNAYEAFMEIADELLQKITDIIQHRKCDNWPAVREHLSTG